MDAAGLRSRIEATLATDADHRRQAETELKAVCFGIRRCEGEAGRDYWLTAIYRQRRTLASSTPF
jgi:hypothetical protein